MGNRCDICGILDNPGECRGFQEVCDAVSNAYKTGIDDLLNAIPDCDYVGVENIVCIAERLKGEMK